MDEYDPTTDPLQRLAACIRQNEDIPLRVSIGCVDMQASWNACRDPSAMLVVLFCADPISATKCACSCVRSSLHLVPSDEPRPRHAVDECETWLRQRGDVSPVLQAIEDCRSLLEKMQRTSPLWGVAAATDDLGLAVTVIAKVGVVSRGMDDWSADLRAADAAESAAEALACDDAGRTSLPDNDSDIDEALGERIRDRLAAMANIVRSVAPEPPNLADVVRLNRERLKT